MSWTAERRYEAGLRAPEGRELFRPDSELLVRPGWRQLVTPSCDAGLNEVSFSQVAPEDAERVIDETIAMYRAHGLPVKWYVGPWTRPEDFGERLLRRGFAEWDARVMGCETDLPLHTSPGVEVVEIGDDELEGYLETTLRGWSMGEDQRAIERDTHLFEIRKRPRTAHFFVARIEGEDVGSAGLFLRPGGFGYLVGGQVLERARGRGAYRALVAARLAFLRARGDGYAVTHARESTAAPMLEHLGLETLFRSECYLLK